MCYESSEDIEQLQHKEHVQQFINLISHQPNISI